MTDCRVGGVIKTHREHEKHRVCLNPFWSLPAIAPIMAGSGFYQNEMKLLEGRPAAPTPPKSAFFLLGVTVRGGCRDDGGPGGRRAAGGGGIACAVLPTAACDLLSSLLTGLTVRFWAHRTALSLRAIRGFFRFVKRLYGLRVQYAASKRRERVCIRARLLSSGVLRLPLNSVAIGRGGKSPRKVFLAGEYTGTGAGVLRKISGGVTLPWPDQSQY